MRPEPTQIMGGDWGDMKKELSKEQVEELRRLVKMPDDEIDISDPDNPPVRDWSRAVRGKFYRPENEYD